jgi:putative transcriptional regulator
MATIRKSLPEIQASRLRVDKERLKAITDAEIAADSDTAPDVSDKALAPEPRVLRAAAGMTQEEFARVLNVPIGTLRNWEQGRTPPDAAAATLFRLMAKDLNHILELLEAA